MAPTYRPYAAAAAAEHGRSDAVVVAYGGGKPARWVAGLGASSASASASSTSAWWVGDPEMKRRARVASYKAYGVEGKVKASIRRGVRWIKAKCSRVLHFSHH